MRALVVTLGSFGLVAGLGCALVVQTLPEVLVGRYTFFVFTAPDRLTRSGHPTLTLSLFPSMVVLPVLGLIVGLVLAAALGRGGWTLTRSGSVPR